MTIKNIKDMRDHALQTLSKLEKRQIDITEAVATAKIYSSIISTVKAELDYHKMLDQVPCIEFLESANIYDTDTSRTIKQTRRIEK